MPGPTRWRGGLLNHAVLSKKVGQKKVDDRVREVLKVVRKTIMTGTPENAPERGRDTPETAALLREIGAQSIVLLKNEGNVLPFKKNQTVSNRLGGTLSELH
jgi:beta-glucosidase